jgi:hypothetical protein
MCAEEPMISERIVDSAVVDPISPEFMAPPPRA